MATKLEQLVACAWVSSPPYLGHAGTDISPALKAHPVLPTSPLYLGHAGFEIPPYLGHSSPNSYPPPALRAVGSGPVLISKSRCLDFGRRPTQKNEYDFGVFFWTAKATCDF